MFHRVNAWSKLWVVALALGAVLAAQVTQAHAWGFYAGAHGGRATVFENNPGLHAGGTSPAREEVISQAGQPVSFSAHAYIKFFTGFDSDHKLRPWPGGDAARDNLDTALVKFLCSGYYSVLPDDGLIVSLYHISDDSWSATDSSFTYANSPYFNIPATATLLDTQTVTGNTVTWNLLSNNLYQDIWKTQDFDDRTISVMLKVVDLPGNVGKAALIEPDGYSITLEGTPAAPVPPSLLFFGSGLACLWFGSARRRLSKL